MLSNLSSLVKAAIYRQVRVESDAIKRRLSGLLSQGGLVHKGARDTRVVKVVFQQKRQHGSENIVASNRKQGGPTNIAGWLDLLSETHDTQPLSGWYIDLRDVLKSSQKHPDPHHGQQLNQNRVSILSLVESNERNAHCERRENVRRHHPRKRW